MQSRERWRSLHFRPEMKLITCVNSLVHAYARARAASTPRSIDLKREREKGERDCLETNCPVHFHLCTSVTVLKLVVESFAEFMHFLMMKRSRVKLASTSIVRVHFSSQAYPKEGLSSNLSNDRRLRVVSYLLTLPPGRGVTLRDGKPLAAGSTCRETGPDDRRTAPSEALSDTLDYVLADRAFLNVNTP